MKAYDLQTVENPSWVKRLSHRRRFEVAAQLLAVRDGETVLDYGTGDGYLLGRLVRLAPGATYHAYEPVAEMRAQALALWASEGLAPALYATRQELQGLKVSKLSCMEVMEHLDSPRLIEVFADFREVLDSDGTLMISVPVEIGLTSLAKNGVRIAARQAQEGTNVANLVNALLGRTAAIERVSRGGYIDSHIGFDHRALRQRIQQEGFKIERQLYAPLPWLGGVLNSQVFWVCRHA